MHLAATQVFFTQDSTILQIVKRRDFAGKAALNGPSFASNMILRLNSAASLLQRELKMKSPTFTLCTSKV